MTSDEYPWGLDLPLMGRDAPFPSEIQGRWVEESEPEMELVIDGSEMTWRGEPRDYQNKRLSAGDEDKVFEVILERTDEEPEDFLSLILTRDGILYAYNVHHVAIFLRPTPST